MPAWILAMISHWSVKAVLVVFFLTVWVASYWLVWKVSGDSHYRQGYAQSLKDNPPNVYKGVTTVNQQPCPPPSVYGIDIGKWAFGLVHKK